MSHMTVSLLGLPEIEPDDRNTAPPFLLVATEGNQIVNHAVSMVYEEER
jgi:hypothetical protein